jgi:hypothetical protein
MLSLAWMRTSFSTVAGGGVRGMAAGIARGAMIQVGATIAVAHLFPAGYPQVGGMTTGKIAGEGVNGTTKQYPISKFKRTGGTGKGISIGRKKIIGVSGIRGMIEIAHDNNSRMINMNSGAIMKEEEIRKQDFLKKY